MKIKKIIIMAITSAIWLPTFAQSPYYYYKGERIPLVNNPSKVCVVSPKIETSSVNFVSRTGVSQVIADDLYNISVQSVPTGNVKVQGTAVSNGTDIILPCYVTTTGDEIIPTNYINVKLKTVNDYPLLEKVAKDYSLEIIRQDTFLPEWYILSITKATGMSSVDVANLIYETGDFAASVADFVSDDVQFSYDPDVEEQWGLYNTSYEGIDISIASAWNYSTGNNVKIGILDQGIEKTHSDLAANIYFLSFDTESGTSPSKYYDVHGTHCAGIAAAVRNNGIYIAGVAPDAKLVDISNSLKGTSNSRIKRADGIMWAWQNGVDIISNSWGSSTKHEAIDEAIGQALIKGRDGKGCIIVFASGNDYSSISYPANCNDRILVVGAIGVNGLKANYSNYGEGLDVVAPGSDILSTLPNNAIGQMSGTSMACPHVAGVAALILERNPSLTSIQVTNIIEKNTKKISAEYTVNKINGTWNSNYGYGLVDAYSAVINTPR